MSTIKHAAMAVLTLGLAGCATITKESAGLPPGARYVAMGSSYAAGPQLGNPKPVAPARCARDQANYATLLAQRLTLDLVDASCSGATTAHLLDPWNELPAQLDSLTPDTRLVTVTIGGNDVNFVRDLYVASCASSSTQRKCPALALPPEADWQKLATNLRAIAQQVRARARKARLVFVDYVTLIPASGSCPAVPMTDANAALMRQMAARLARVTAEVARETGADLLPAGALSQAHTPCDAEPWSTGALDQADGALWHPNREGMRAIADALALKLGGKRAQGAM